MTKKIETSTPRIGVMLYPYEKHFRYSPDEKNKVRTIDATDYVTSIKFVKSKSKASGSFSITLKAVKNWRDIVRPGDWLMIYHSRFPFTMKDSNGLKILGNVDRISREKVVNSDGTKNIIYTIVGRDFGKILEETRFYFNPFLDSKKSILDLKYIISKAGEKSIVGTPESFVRTYLNLFFGDGKITKDQETTDVWDHMDQVRIPKEIMKVFGVTGRKFGDLLHIRIHNVQGYSWSSPTNNQFDGNVWDILKSVSNPMMNELYTSLDYIEDANGNRKIVPCITLRELPYSKGVFNKLDAHRIDDSIIINEDLGFSDHERYNFLYFNFLNPFYNSKTFALALADQETISLGPGRKETSLIPFVDSFSIDRYGVRLWDADTKFCFIDGSEKSKVVEKTDIELGRKWQHKLIDWWNNLVRTESGTIVIKAFSNDYYVDEYKPKVILPKGTLISQGNDNNVDITGGKMKKFFESTTSSLDRLQNRLNNISSVNKGIFSVKSVAHDHITVGNNIYNSDSGMLYQLEAHSLEWAAPGYSQIALTVTRGVKGVPGKATYQFLDDIKDTDKQEVATTIIKRNKKNGKGD